MSATRGVVEEISEGAQDLATRAQDTIWEPEELGEPEALYRDEEDEEDDRAAKRVRTGVWRGRRRASRLGSLFAALPVEIAIRIYPSLDPIDLVHLARTSKDLRAMLLKSSAEPIWRMALQPWLDQGIPDMPDLISLPALAALVFCSSCYQCGAVDVVDIDWHLLKRLCSGCRKEQIMPGERIRKEIGIRNDILELLTSSELDTDTRQDSTVAARLFYLPDAAAIKASHDEADRDSMQSLRDWWTLHEERRDRVADFVEAAREWVEKYRTIKRPPASWSWSHSFGYWESDDDDDDDSLNTNGWSSNSTGWPVSNTGW